MIDVDTERQADIAMARDAAKTDPGKAQKLINKWKARDQVLDQANQIVCKDTGLEF